MQTYDVAAIQIILGKGSCKDLVRVEETGVFPHIGTGVFTTAETDLLTWMYACELDGLDAPDLLKTPSLPIPFTANELAAFMLDGAGYFLLNTYGEWDDGPDEEALKTMGKLANRAQEAVRGAYKAYQVAENVVGEFDQKTAVHAHQLEKDYQQKKQEANKKEGIHAKRFTRDEQGKIIPAADGEVCITDEEYWARRVRATDSVADLLKALRVVEKQADAEYAKWRKAMVRQLLPQKTDTQAQADTVPVTVVQVFQSEPKPKRRTLWDVVTPHIVETMRAGQYASAKQLFNALEAKAGAGSPFDKGEGSNRYSLFAREISQPMAMKTLQTRWPVLKAAAKK